MLNSPSPDERARLNNLLQKHRNNRLLLLEKKADYAAGEAPLILLNQIAAEEHDISELEREISLSAQIPPAADEPLPSSASVEERAHSTRRRVPALKIIDWLLLAIGLLVITIVLFSQTERDRRARADITRTAVAQQWAAATATAAPTATAAAAATEVAQFFLTATAGAMVAGSAAVTVTPPAITSTILPASGLVLGSAWVAPQNKSVYVYVPAGQFVMGSSDKDSDAINDEKPQHVVNLDAFWISQTEVTNKQWSAFIEAGGYSDPRLWTDAGWKWRQDRSITRPGCWDEKRWNQPDYPVVCVSWYEAVAYTRWLSHKMGLDVRLPTEAQWEKAARGTDGRIWPWGNDPPDGMRLNYCDAQCENNWKDQAVDDGYPYTAPVGSYVVGASPYGALDIAGNAFEWTSTRWGGCDNAPGFAYPYRGDDGREDPQGTDCRVVRGGSWAALRAYVRGGYRDWREPDLTIGYYGLRVVVSPVNSGS